MIDWEDGKVFFPFRYLKSDPILGYCLPLTMHTEDKTEKVRISLNARTAVPHVSTSQNAIKLRTNIGVNGAVETTTVPVPKVRKYFLFHPSLQDREPLPTSQHSKSKSLHFLVICHDEIVVTEMDVLCSSFLIKSQTIAHWQSGLRLGWFIKNSNNSFIRGWQ